MIENTLIDIIASFNHPSWNKLTLSSKSERDLLVIARDLRVDKFDADDYAVLGLDRDSVNQVLALL